MKAVKMGGNCSTHRVGDKCNTDREVVSNRLVIIIKNNKDKIFVMIFVAALAERKTT